MLTPNWDGAAPCPGRAGVNARSERRACRSRSGPVSHHSRPRHGAQGDSSDHAAWRNRPRTTNGGRFRQIPRSSYRFFFPPPPAASKPGPFSRSSKLRWKTRCCRYS